MVCPEQCRELTAGASSSPVKHTHDHQQAETAANLYLKVHLHLLIKIQICRMDLKVLPAIVFNIPYINIKLAPMLKQNCESYTAALNVLIFSKLCILQSN